MKKPTKMLTKVARAIWHVRREEEDQCDLELEDISCDHSVWAEARAAVAALRKPTKDVISTGSANISPWWSPAMSATKDFANTEKAAASAWGGMIDAILDEDSPL